VDIEPVLIKVEEFGAMGRVGRSRAWELLKTDPDAPTVLPIGPKMTRVELHEAVGYWKKKADDARRNSAAIPSRRVVAGKVVAEVAA
jgi:hypothetical protein